MMARLDMSRTKLWLCLLVVGTLAALSGGCAPPRPATLAELQHRSVFDLGCPSYQLRLHHIDQRTKVVVGCGRRLIYVHSCDRQGPAGGACTWLLDTPSFTAAEWPQHQAASTPATQPIVYLTPAVQCPGGQTQPVVVKIESAAPGRRVATELLSGGVAPPAGPAAGPAAGPPPDSPDPRIRTELFPPPAGSDQSAAAPSRAYRTELFDRPKPPPTPPAQEPDFGY